jgi:probable F420-dependent oxidoreductase
MTTHPFRFGVIAERSARPDTWLALARRTEAAGYATLLIRDHLIPDVFGDQLAPLIALTAAAAATTTLRLGTLVLDNDFRHPALLAKEAATLDVLSGGRLELGLGAGWLRAEYGAAGIPFDQPGTRIGRLAEAVAVITGLWAGGPLHFGGQHYIIDGLDSFPLPVQRPRPPILLGGGQRRMLTLAGQTADIVSILTTSVASGAMVDDVSERTPAAVEQKLAWVRAGAGDRFGTIELNLLPTVIITDDRRSRTEDLIRARRWAGVSAEDVWAMPAVLIGSADQIVTEIEARRARYGFSYFVVSDEDLEVFAPIVARLAGR